MGMRARITFGMLALGCCAWTVGCTATERGEPSQADLDAIQAVIDAEIAAANAGDADAFVSILSDDVVVIAPGQPTIEGDAAHQWVRDFMGAVSIELGDYETDELEVEGDWAYHRYRFRWTITPREDGDAFTEHGAGIHLFRRGADGSWKMTHDIWNSDTPAGEM